MKRTNIYLDDGQLDTLRRLGEQRGQPVAAMIREAVETWLEAQGARPIPRDEWEHRFDAILKRRRKGAAERQPSEDDVMRDVMLAVQEVRKARSARRP
jgi:hypothetical protein